MRSFPGVTSLLTPANALWATAFPNTPETTESAETSADNAVNRSILEACGDFSLER